MAAHHGHEDCLIAGLVQRLGDPDKYGIVDETTADRIRKLHDDFLHERSSRHRPKPSCPPLYIKPESRAFWMPDSWGGGSSLYWTSEERAATVSELITDLVMVYVFSTVVHEASNLMVGMSGLNDDGHSGHHRLLSSKHPASNGTVSDDLNPDVLNGTLMSMIMICSLCIPCWMHWWNLLEWENAYGQNDLVHIIKWAAEIVLLGHLGGWVPACASKSDCKGFAVYLVFCKCLQVAYIQYVRWANHALFSFENNIATFKHIAEIICWSLVAVTSSHHGSSTIGHLDTLPLVLWWISLFLPLLLHWLPMLCFGHGCEHHIWRLVVGRCSTSQMRIAPRHIQYLQERLNLILIVAIGEMIVSLLNSFPEHEDSGSIFTTSSTLTSLNLLFFVILRLDALDTSEHIRPSAGESADKAHGYKEKHAFTISTRRAMAYVMATMAINLGVLFMAAGLFIPEHDQMTDSDTLFGVGAFSTSIFTTLKEALHQDNAHLSRLMGRTTRLAVRLLLAFMILTLALTPVPLSPAWFRSVIIFIYFLQLLVDRCGRLILEDENSDVYKEVSIEDKETNLLDAMSSAESFEEGKQHRPSQLESVNDIIDKLLRKKGR